MKTNITLNIGLTFPIVNVHDAIHECERAGITILASGVVSGMWEGKPEQTLVIQGLAFESLEFNARLYVAACILSQHSIAVYRNGKGELIGKNPQGYEFDQDLFHFHAREEKPHLSPCEAIQARHRAKADEFKGMDKWEASRIRAERDGWQCRNPMK